MEFLFEFLGQFLIELWGELMALVLPKERGSKKLRILAGCLPPWEYLVPLLWWSPASC